MTQAQELIMLSPLQHAVFKTRREGTDHKRLLMVQVCTEAMKRSPIGCWHLKHACLCLLVYLPIVPSMQHCQGLLAGCHHKHSCKQCGPVTGEKDYSLLRLDVAFLGQWFPVTWGNMLSSSSRAQHSWTLLSWHCRHQVPVKWWEALTQWHSFTSNQDEILDYTVVDT